MNILTKEMRRSLKEIDLGLKGELTITTDMEDLGNALFFDQVPPPWAKRAYASLNGLSGWYADLIMRIKVGIELTGISSSGCHDIFCSIRSWSLGPRTSASRPLCG